MQRSTVIGAEARLFSDLFHQGRFTVPWHQRYYDWKAGDVRVLLHDIDEAVKEDRDCYFLGAVMLVEVESRLWEINDGQQRMVTISLICAALCRRFARSAGDSQREGLALRMLFDLDDKSAWTLDDAEHYPPRISPPRNDAMRYRQMIRGNTIGTNGMLNTAWEEIDKFFSLMGLEMSERYFDFLLGKLEVACLRVPRRIDPNAVYETINCRGKQLDDLDLIRNFLYSHFNAVEDSERRTSVHENLERIRVLIPNTVKASEYMRCHLQCRFGFLRKDNFYRDVRGAVRMQRDKKRDKKHGFTKSPADYAFHLIKQITLPESLNLFRTMTATNPSPEFIQAFETASRTRTSPRNLAVFLRELRGYKVTQPLIFALLTWYIRESDGHRKRSIARLINRNLSRLATFVLRTAFVAPKFEPSHFETEFSNCAKDIMTANDMPDDAFVAFLRKCDRSEYGVLDDSRFQNAMAEARMTGARKIKQFLLGINGNARLLNQRFCTIEHILPESQQHWGGWTGFKDVDGADWVQRIGNLTLMGPTDNKPGEKYNAAFAKKRASYGDSSLSITRELKDYEDWTPADIEARQRAMVKQAVRVWTFV